MSTRIIALINTTKKSKVSILKFHIFDEYRRNFGMNTKYLYTMKTVLETGSYQKAASKLNYTQSTVTFHIQQIEQELDIKLFD